MDEDDSVDAICRSHLMRLLGKVEETYPPLNYQDLTFSSYVNYWQFTNYYQKTKNVYYLMLLFSETVSAGFSPPAWVLDEINQRWAAHLANPDPERFASQFGVSGKASGSTNPFDAVQAHVSRFAAMADMYRIISIFDVSKIGAARAVRIKHDLKEKPKYLVELYNDWLQRLPAVSPPEEILSAREHPRFVDSFPPKARKLLRK